MRPMTRLASAPHPCAIGSSYFLPVPKPLQREDIVSGRIEELMQEAQRLGLTTRIPPEQRQASNTAILHAFGENDTPTAR